MTMFLRTSSPDGSIITGHVLHLAVWAPDAPGTTLVHGGTWVALCSRPYARPIHYRVTGPGVRGWDRHAHWPTCTHCVRRWGALGAAGVEQFERVRQHDAAQHPNRCRWRHGADMMGPRCGLVDGHPGHHFAVMHGSLVRWGPPHLNPPAATTRERETR